MEVSLNKNSFVRRVNDDVLFYNPRNAACIVLNNAGALAESMSRSWRDLDDVLTEIAKRLETTVRLINADYLPIIEYLLNNGLVDGRGGNAKISENRICAGVANDISKTSSSPHRKFYQERNLLFALHIDITSNCNERCVHCYHPEHAAKNLPLEHVVSVLTDFKKMNGMTVYISGGECMTHPDFEKILRACRERDFNIAILSNLSLCDSHCIEFLKEINPQYLNVSLYSMKSEVHDAITAISGSWRRTMDAILACEKAGLEIRIATPVLKWNRNALKDLKSFAEAHNMHLIPDFNIFTRSNQDASNLQYACTPEELESTLREHKDLLDMGWKNVCRDDLEAQLCDIGRCRVHLNANGDFYPCPSMYGYVLGNVRDTRIGDVWNGKKLKYLRELKWKHMGKCVSCEHRQFCEPCVSYNFNATGDLFKTIPEKCHVSAIVHRVYG